MKNEKNHKGKNQNKSVSNQPIQSEKQVEKSNDKKINQDFPGYPHYPASEDIMNPQNHTGRVAAELDEVSRRDLNRMHLDKARDKRPSKEENAADDLGIVPGTEADVTKDDLLSLGSRYRDMDMGEDEERFHPSMGSGGAFEATEAITDRDLENDGVGIDRWLQRTGDDLDVPGQELDDRNEMIGEEDEENNYYSLGGDEKEANEEDNRNNY